PIIDQTPVPPTAASAASIKSPSAHCSWSTPAFAAVGGALLVSTTSSKVEHDPLAIVQRSVTLDPAVSPVTVVVGELILVITAPFAAPWNVQVPVPGPAALPARVKNDVLHCA